MTARYELLINAMRAAGEVVTIAALTAVCLLLFRFAIRLMLAKSVPFSFQRIMYDVTDLLLIGIVWTPFLLTKG